MHLSRSSVKEQPLDCVKGDLVIADAPDAAKGMIAVDDIPRSRHDVRGKRDRVERFRQQSVGFDKLFASGSSGKRLQVGSFRL